MRTLAGFILLIVLAMPANAQWHGHGGGYHGGFHGGFRPGGFGGGLGGFFGGLVGGTIGSLLRPQEVPVAPQWPYYCYRFRSFNPQTGYWIGYDGIPRFCQ